jgi:hypothetical protein
VAHVSDLDIKNDSKGLRAGAWWEQTGTLLSAMAMRSFLKEQEDTPPGLGKRTLEPYFMAVVRESSRGHEDSTMPQRSTRRQRDPPTLIPFGQTSDRPVMVESSPDQEPDQGVPPFTR